MLKTPIGRLRVVGFIEGISYLLLLFIAMPLKYFADMPAPVTIVGGMHGFLFVLFLAAVAHVTFVHRWSIMKVLWAVIASFLPFGTFILDSQLKKES
ncbi:DUF3817 domain-containing protein [Paenibacillus lutrae]|uniref:DUF3817 domain-containing protein n=1 Tax=Paenibacillus lutrae TaxID=2078573 RepID=A0A7X3FIE9_9BACL|nr:DUF3817 domain-containing protein [Paenibacillus lutrae]MVP00251.1 DUF3817 domain-containing protein [Paenibacillus lutrae]